MDEQKIRLADLKFEREYQAIMNKAYKDIKRVVESHNSRGVLRSGIFIGALEEKCLETISEVSKSKLEHDVSAINESPTITAQESLSWLNERQEELVNNLRDTFAINTISDWVQRCGLSSSWPQFHQQIKLGIDRVLKQARVEAEIALMEGTKDMSTPLVEEISIKDLSFIKSESIRNIVQRDIFELNRVLKANLSKTTIILSGSVIEALLLDALQQNGDKVTQSSKAESRPLEQWRLESLIDVSYEIGLIDPAVTKFSHSLRNYRNLIHPGREIRDRLQVAIEEARIAVQVLLIVVRSLVAGIV